MSTPLLTESSTFLTAADRCDRCNARAQVLAVLLSGGELLFCGHHARAHREALALTGIYIVETPDSLESSEESSEQQTPAQQPPEPPSGNHIA